MVESWSLSHGRAEQKESVPSVGPLSNTGIGRSQRWGIEPTSPCLDRRLEHNALSTTLRGPLAGLLQSSTHCIGFCMHCTCRLRNGRTLDCRNGTFTFGLQDRPLMFPLAPQASLSPRWSRMRQQQLG